MGKLMSDKHVQIFAGVSFILMIVATYVAIIITKAIEYGRL